MPEFTEYKPGETSTRSNDGTGKKKKTIKNKWFFIALAGVVILVIIQKLRKTKEDESGYYSVPLGYSGFPETTGGAVVADNSDVYGALDELAGQFNTALEDVYKENDTNIKNIITQHDIENKQLETVIDDVTSQLDIVNKKYDDVVDRADRQSEEMRIQNIISLMKENSDKALITPSQSEKDYLHNLNMQYADDIGATYNESDGYYYINGQRIYSTALQTSNAQKYSSSTPSSGSTINYNTTIKKMMDNSKAYAGADTATKNALYLENQDLGKSIGLTYDDTSGKWKTSTGADAWDYSTTHPTTNATGSTSISRVSAADKNSKTASAVRDNDLNDYYQKHEVFDIGGFSSPVVIPKTTTETSAPTTNTQKPAWLVYADEQIAKQKSDLKKSSTKTSTTKSNTSTKSSTTKSSTKTSTPRNTLDVNKSSYRKTTGFSTK